MRNCDRDRLSFVHGFAVLAFSNRVLAPHEGKQSKRGEPVSRFPRKLLCFVMDSPLLIEERERAMQAMAEMALQEKTPLAGADNPNPIRAVRKTAFGNLV